MPNYPDSVYRKLWLMERPKIDVGYHSSWIRVDITITPPKGTSNGTCTLGDYEPDGYRIMNYIDNMLGTKRKEDFLTTHLLEDAAFITADDWLNKVIHATFKDNPISAPLHYRIVRKLTDKIFIDILRKAWCSRHPRFTHNVKYSMRE